MAYSKRDFLEHRNRRFVIEPFEQNLNLTPTGYDLRLGYGIVLPQKKSDTVVTPKDTGFQGSLLKIPGHRGALFVTLERIQLSGKVLGTIHGKARFSAKGLITQSVTVDPNFGTAEESGQLFLYFYNTSPIDISIKVNDPIATLVLSALDTETNAEPNSKTYENILSHYDAAYVSLVKGSVKLCDPIRNFLTRNKSSSDAIAFIDAVSEMSSFNEEVRNIDS